MLTLPANQLFFARYANGNGQIYLCATGLKADDSNFAKHSVFVPILYRIAFSSAKFQPSYYVAIKEDVIEIEKVNLGANQSLKLVSDNFEIIPEIRHFNGKTMLYIADQVKNAGFYEVKKGDSTLAVVSFNDNRIESDMHYDEQTDLLKLFNKNQVAFLNTKTDSVAAAVAVKNNGTELWKLCLILALVFIAVETLLVRFYHIQTHTNS